LAQVNTHGDKMEKELLEQAEAVADLDRKLESPMLLSKQRRTEDLHPQIDKLQAVLLMDMERS
jgi:hypothetical protein